MRTLLALARASHFAPTVAVTAFTTALSVSAGRGAGAGWVAAAVLAGQLSVGWSNDWLDRDRDRAVGRRDKPLVRGDISDDVLINGAVVAALGAVALSLASGWRATLVHAAAIALAWGYNAGLKSTPLSVVPYAAAFGLLPAFVTQGLSPPAWPPWWAVTAGALLGAGAHFANVLPDLERDRRTAVRGLPHRLPAGAAVGTATMLLAAATTVVAVATAPPAAITLVALVITGLIIVAVPLSWMTGRRDIAFNLAIAAAAGGVVALLGSGSRLT